jgi:hypothetical protein
MTSTDTLTELTDAIDTLNTEMFELNGGKELFIEFSLHWTPYAWRVLFAEFPILSDEELIWDEETDTHVPIEEQLRYRFKQLQDTIGKLALNEPTKQFEDNSIWWGS